MVLKKFKQYCNINESLSTKEISSKIKKDLLEENGYGSWEDFIDEQELGDCQWIVSSIIRFGYPGVVKVFGEIEIIDPIDPIDEGKVMTHHWVEINGEIYDFSKGTLKYYVYLFDKYGTDSESQSLEYKPLSK